jgi:hypothetical protein
MPFVHAEVRPSVLRAASGEKHAPEARPQVAVHLILVALIVACSCASYAHAQELPTRVPPPQVSQFRVELSMEDSPPFEPGRPLRFVARAEPADKRLEYHFYFGDGHTSGWVRENQVRHTYANIGAFQAVVFAREPAPEGTPARPSIRSNRVTITIVPQAEQPKPQQPVARLEILSPELRAGEAVQARAYLDPAMERLEYRFNFGDGEPAEFQPGAAMEHRYAAPGMYEAFVQVQQGNRLIAESERVRVAVAPVLAHRLLLEVDRRNLLAGQAVRFSWRIEPHAPDVLYLIDFGDGNQSPQGAQSPVEHVYAEPREYRALLRARIGIEEVISNEVLVSVSAVDRDNLYLLIALIVAAIGVLLAAWRIVRRIRTRKEPSGGDTDTLTHSGVSVNPYRDPGFQAMEFGSPAKPPLEVRLNPVPDSGKQTMDQGTAARKKKGVSHE